MARSETTRTVYTTVLLGGVREANVAGELYDTGDDEPFVVQLVKETKVEVRDARGKRWSESGSRDREVLGELSIEEAAGLLNSLADNITYAAVVGERRATTEHLRK